MPKPMTLEELQAAGRGGTSTADLAPTDETPEGDNLSEYLTNTGGQTVDTANLPSRTRTRSRTTARATDSNAEANTHGQSDSRQPGTVVLEEALQHTFTDRAGREITATIPEGSRVNVTHEHESRRLPSCAVCMAVYTHERAELARQREENRANGVQEGVRITTEPESYTMTDSQENEYQIDLPVGSRISTASNHEHENRRRPSCALCMAIYEREREVNPPQTTSSAPKDCRCGCDGQTKGGDFLPGHDARFYGRVIKYIRWKHENVEKLASGEVQEGQYATDLGFSLPAELRQGDPRSVLPDTYRAKLDASL